MEAKQAGLTRQGEMIELNLNVCMEGLTGPLSLSGVTCDLESPRKCCCHFLIPPTSAFFACFNVSFIINNIDDRFARSPLDGPTLPTVLTHLHVKAPLDSFQKPVTPSLLRSLSVVVDKK